MKTFREYVDSRDSGEEPLKPLFGTPPMPGQLKAAYKRAGDNWDRLKGRDPQRFHNMFTQPRRVRAGIANAAQGYADLAGDENELSRLRQQSLLALNRTFARQKDVLRNRS